jgi:hypothetical protein
MAPPIQTIRELDIQGYYEKSDRFDQLELLIESCVKSIRQMRIVRQYQEGLRKIVDNIPEIYQIQSVDEVVSVILSQTADFLSVSDLYLCMNTMTGDVLYQGMGSYATRREEGIECLAGFVEKEKRLL